MKIFIYLFLLAISAIFAEAYRETISPINEVLIGLPMKKATASFQTWFGFINNQPFKLKVKSPNGEIQTDLWIDWGPASSVNLYYTPENWIVAIGGVGTYIAIEIKDNKIPVLLDNKDVLTTDDTRWKYIGMADKGVFYSPNVKEECISIFMGKLPFRKKYQVEGSCHK